MGAGGPGWRKGLSVRRAIGVEFFLENLADVASQTDLKTVRSEMNGNNALGNSRCNSQEDEV